ncbi:Mur ligase family protein [Sulfoacidibacillus thermotolerans]|nr:Mur ligase family protein [Sulfoacidibacillus thermotolerans]
MAEWASTDFEAMRVIKKWKSRLALWVGQITLYVLRLIGRRGTSLPGFLAYRLSPDLLFNLLTQLDTCVFVTGTNGKTTTSALLYSILSDEKNLWLTNKDGANLMQGLLAAFLPHVTATGRLGLRKAILEVDEATLPRITERFHPTMVVVTNVVRDQLDRYGEVDQALAMLRQGISYPGIQLITNADDPLAASLGIERELTSFYGMDEVLQDTQTRNEVRDGAFCLMCGQEIEYSHTIYGQFGHYHCPNGDFTRPTPDYGGILRANDASLIVRWRKRNTEVEQFAVPSPVIGLYNYYNLLAAVATACTLGISTRKIVEAVTVYEAPLGRMQVYAGTPERILALIKNPAGANSVLRTIETDSRAKAVCFAINDADADGRDVSWLWDIDLESFLATAVCDRYFCAGHRALDMALRLLYAGVQRKQIEILDALSDVVKATESLDVPVYVLSTYTALYPLGTYLREASR